MAAPASGASQKGVSPSATATRTIVSNSGVVQLLLLQTGVETGGTFQPDNSPDNPQVFTPRTTPSPSSSTQTSQPNGPKQPATTRPGGPAVPAATPDTKQTSNLQPSPSNPSTSSSALPSSPDSQSAAANGSSKGVMPSGFSATDKGLVAATAVCGALFLVTLIAFGIFCCRQRRKPRRNLNEIYASAESKDLTTSSLEKEIEELRGSLRERDTQLRDNQAAMMRQPRQGPSAGPTLNMSDKDAHRRFRQLSKAINDWTLTYFKTLKPNFVVTRELKTALKPSRVDLRALLQGTRTKYLPVRMLVANALTDAINRGELLGQSYSSLARIIGSPGTQRESGDWRAQTVALLAKNPQWFQAECSTAIDNLTRQIDGLVSPFCGVDTAESHQSRLASLQQYIVEPTARLAVDLGGASAYHISMESAGVTFDSSHMEDVFQDQDSEHGLDAEKNHATRNPTQRSIAAMVFPIVTRQLAQDGDVSRGQHGLGRDTVISKGQVLLAAPRYELPASGVQVELAPSGNGRSELI